MYKLLAFIVLISIIIFILLSYPQSKSLSPSSLQNQLQLQLDNQITAKNLTISNLDIDTYNQKIRFKLIEDNQIITAVLSTQKDISLQINALHKIIKTVKINQTYPKTIDLSLNKAYATIENY